VSQLPVVFGAVTLIEMVAEGGLWEAQAAGGRHGSAQSTCMARTLQNCMYLMSFCLFKHSNAAQGCKLCIRRGVFRTYPWAPVCSMSSAESVQAIFVLLEFPSDSCVELLCLLPSSLCDSDMGMGVHGSTSPT
jgi:hypothetical protein